MKTKNSLRNKVFKQNLRALKKIRRLPREKNTRLKKKRKSKRKRYLK